jgi:hypothetical protein
MGTRMVATDRDGLGLATMSVRKGQGAATGLARQSK